MPPQSQVIQNVGTEVLAFWGVFWASTNVLKYFHPINTCIVIYCYRYQGPNIRQVFLRFLWLSYWVSNVFLPHIRKHILPEILCLTVRMCGSGGLLSIANEWQDPQFFYTIFQPLHKRTLISDHRYSFVFNIFFLLCP